MLETFFTSPFLFILWLLALFIAITIHEFSHALVADRLGDPTPRLMGRLTLNPLAHLDTLGTLMLLLFRFGWGKPVQFDPFNLKNPRRDAALISLAGPTSNLLLALILSILVRTPVVPPFLIQFLLPIIILNIMLAIFNLMPIHPLDGFKIVQGLLPEDQAREWATLERYGFLFLLLLIFPIGGKSLLFSILDPVINFLLYLFLGKTGLYY